MRSQPMENAGVPGAFPPSGSSDSASRLGLPPPGSTPGPSPGVPPGAEPAGEAEGLVQIRVDPAKIPSADALKPYLFPGLFAIVSDDQSVQIVTRKAFSSLVRLTNPLVRLSFLMGYQQAQRTAAAAAATGAGTAGSGAVPAGGPAQSQSNPRERDPRGSSPR
jgi:hypothetical protein